MRTPDCKSDDHAGVADGGMGEIIDTEEGKPMVLSVEALKACAGRGAVNPYTTEACELYFGFHGGSTSSLVNQFLK